MSRQQGLGSFAFWIITSILFVSSISMNGAITHLSALLTDRGITARDAAICASILGGAGGEAAITPYLLARYFGLRAFSTLYGLTWTFYAAAGAIGPVILGRAFDVTGSYASLLTVLAGVLTLIAGMNLFLPPYSEFAQTIPE